MDGCDIATPTVAVDTVDGALSDDEPGAQGVARLVELLIADATDGQPHLTRLLRQLMARPGRVLAPDGRAKWPHFVLQMSRLLGGASEPSVIAAAAVELMVAAADVADDIVDAEWDSALANQGRALNASFALLLLAQRCAARLHEHVGPGCAGKIQKMLIDGGLAACTGQDLDLLFEQSATVDEEQAHEMTRRKSGSIVALACQVGAALATDDPDVLAAASAFGSNLGTAAQLLNDLAGIDPMHFQPGTDLQRRKKTLPIAYGLRCAREEGITGILAWYEQPHQQGDSGEWELAKRLSELGALDYTWIVADTHRREALAALDRLVQITGNRAVWQLRRLVPAPDQQAVGSAA